MIGLKPCPFCGKDPNQATAELGDRPCFYYECKNPKCGATEMGWHNTEQEAINAWNTRPIEDALRNEIAQLQADNRSLVEQMNQMALKPNQTIIERHEYDHMRYTESLEAENAKLEKLNSAALERLSYHACPSDRNNYGQPCNDSDDCVACWREYLGGKDE
jgi:Lar family restriction alleviation protein